MVVYLSEPPERALGGLLDVLRAAVQAWRTLHPAGIEIRIEVESELGRDHHCKPRLCRPPPLSVCSASMTAFGLRAATRSNANAGPSGVRRPCSQLRSVATLTPIMSAKLDPAGIAVTDHARRVRRRVHPMVGPIPAAMPGVS